MRTRTRLVVWRIAVLLLLSSLVFSPFVSAPTLAAPPVQGDSPDVPLTDNPLVPQAPGDHLVTNIVFGPDTPNILHTDQNVDVSFSYSTTEAGGVRIFVRPFTAGEPSPGFAAHGSPLYPTSATGSGSGFFTILGDAVVVDEVQIQILNANQTLLLFETFLPVHFLFSPSNNIVTNLDLTPDTPDVLGFNQNVDFSFDYSNTQAGGVRIWARPFSNGSLTPNYGAHGSQLYPTGSGESSGFFNVTSGQVVVDQIRIQMWNSNETTLLFEAFLPVYYRYRSLTNSVTQVELGPDTPNVFKYNNNVALTFNYNTNEAGGVRIFARPFSGTGLSPSYAAHGSDVYQVGSGSGLGSFNLTAGPTLVDKIRIQMWNANQTTLLFETFLPVHLLWAGAGPPPGPDMSVNAIEVTQAIQDLNNSVDLVAGKRTYARVHVSSPVSSSDVFATLSGRRGFITLFPTLNPGNPGGDINVLASPDRAQINDSFWFELPSSWTASGSLTLTARLDPNNAKNDLNLGNNARSVTVNFINTPPLRLRLFNVQYTVGSNTFLAANSHLSSLESWLRRAYPISNLSVSRQTFVYPDAGLPNVDVLHGWLAFGKLIRILFNGEDPRVVYYGVVDDGGGFMRGKAAGIPGTIAAGPAGSGSFGWDFDGSYNDWYGGHEIGHTRGRFHAEFCGAGGGIAYPYPDGRISPVLTGNGAIYGFDITTRAVYGPNWKDVMTYCSNQWVSDYTYEGIRSFLALQLTSTPDLSPAATTASQFLLVSGLADLESNTATLDNVYLVDQEATIPLPEPGDWSIVLVGASDTDLATYPFEPEELTDADDSPGTPAVIAEAVPWVDGVVRVEIRYQDEVKASRSASANAPGVSLTSPADGSELSEGPFQVTWTGSDPDGDPLTYSLLYSNDGGSNWQMLATNLTESSLELHTGQLPGGSGMLRVLVSDGFLSGQATSGAFTLPLHAPQVQIVSPNPDQVFYPTQQVDLQGAGYDLEDETMPDEAFVWSSDVEGFLGTGAYFIASGLTTGSHVITLTVTDSDGMSSQAQRTILVSDSESAEAVNLVVAPSGVGETFQLGGDPVQIPVSVRSTGASELTWTTSGDAPWLTINTPNGQTPADLLLTLDPGSLAVGTYSTIVTFSALGAQNESVELVVTLQVDGKALFLPFVGRTQ